MHDSDPGDRRKVDPYSGVLPSMKDEVVAALVELLQGKPSRLADLAMSYKNEGKAQKEVYAVFLDVWSERVVVDGMPVVPQLVEDTFCDVLDRISGFCSQHRRIWV